MSRTRRLVTGHDRQGRSTIARDEALPLVPGTTEDGRTLAEIWETAAAGRPNGDGGGGTIRVVELPPRAVRTMHRTDTVDYAIVLAGEVWLVLETAETALRAGDIVVQRGTAHGWQNRSGAPARLVFVNLTGQVDAMAGFASD